MAGSHTGILRTHTFPPWQRCFIYLWPFSTFLRFSILFSHTNANGLPSGASAVPPNVKNVLLSLQTSLPCCARVEATFTCSINGYTVKQVLCMISLLGPQVDEEKAQRPVGCFSTERAYHPHTPDKCSFQRTLLGHHH